MQVASEGGLFLLHSNHSGDYYRDWNVIRLGCMNKGIMTNQRGFLVAFNYTIR